MKRAISKFLVVMIVLLAYSTKQSLALTHQNILGVWYLNTWASNPQGNVYSDILNIRSDGYVEITGKNWNPNTGEVVYESVHISRYIFENGLFCFDKWEDGELSDFPTSLIEDTLRLGHFVYTRNNNMPNQEDANQFSYHINENKEVWLYGYEGFFYKNVDGVAYPYSNVAQLKFPSIIEGYPVKEIRSLSLYAQIHLLTSLIIPEGIEKLSASLNELIELESVYVPASLQQIGKGAFSGRVGLPLTFYGPSNSYAQKWVESNHEPFWKYVVLDEQLTEDEPTRTEDSLLADTENTTNESDCDADRWLWPVPDNMTVYSPYNVNSPVLRKKREGEAHHGIDISKKANLDVVASRSGTVHEIGLGFNDKGVYDPESNSLYVTLKHDINGEIYYSSYWHLQVGTICVNVGDYIEKGSVIAKTGNTGLKKNHPFDGTHLHFMIVKHDKWIWGKKKANYYRNCTINVNPFNDEIIWSNKKYNDESTLELLKQEINESPPITYQLGK